MYRQISLLTYCDRKATFKRDSKHIHISKVWTWIILLFNDSVINRSNYKRFYFVAKMVVLDVLFFSFTLFYAARSVFVITHWQLFCHADIGAEKKKKLLRRKWVNLGNPSNLAWLLHRWEMPFIHNFWHFAYIPMFMQSFKIYSCKASSPQCCDLQHQKQRDKNIIQYI